MSEASNLISRLGLSPHPEGGWYRRVYESGTSDAGERPVMTSILYLLAAGEISRWHVVDADEAWHFSGGAGIRLYTFDPESRTLQSVVLGPASAEESAPSHVVPAGVWQAAEPVGALGLVGCTVAPGFRFDGFSLIAETGEGREHFEGPLRGLDRLL